MRIHFQNLTRPKKAAKFVADATDRPLAVCQQAIAKACGYRDWRDMEISLSVRGDDFNSSSDNSGRLVGIEVEVIANVVKSLEVNAGAVQYALACSRIFGGKLVDPRKGLEVRRRLFERQELSPVARREPGAVGEFKTSGRSGESVILRSYGEPTRVISHRSVESLIAGSEYVSPKAPASLFIPMRLYLAYGVWTEARCKGFVFTRLCAALAPSGRESSRESAALASGRLRGRATFLGNSRQIRISLVG